MITHYEGCNPNYPEKAADEKPQATTDVELCEGEIARTCLDCGAFEIINPAGPWIQFGQGIEYNRETATWYQQQKVKK